MACGDSVGGSIVIVTAAKIMVVEDQGPVGLDIQHTLTRPGCAVPAVVVSAAEALQKVAEVQPDQVLMDVVQYDKTDVVEVTQQIRAGFGVPVIFLTAHAVCLSVQRAKEAEPHTYVLKPFHDQVLVTSI